MKKQKVKYTNLTIILVLFIFALYFAPFLDLFVNFLSDKFGLNAAIAVGYLYSFSFTSGAASVMLSNMDTNPILTALLAATGSALADLTIYNIFRNKLRAEVESLFKFIRIDRLLNKKARPLIAFIIIGSPLPDELGMMLLSHSKKMSKLRIFCMCFLANFLFILFIVQML